MANQFVAHKARNSGLRFDLDATLDDPRNWKGDQGQREQALLRQIVRQSNALDYSHDRRAGWSVISLGQVEDYTGIKRATSTGLLEGLALRGFLQYEVTNPGTSKAVYRVKLNRRVDHWPVAFVHHWLDVNRGDSPF